MEGDRAARVEKTRLSFSPEIPGRYRSGSGTAQWGIEPDVGRVADGVPARVDRLRGLGNAIVPQVAEMIFKAIERVQTGHGLDKV